MKNQNRSNDFRALGLHIIMYVVPKILLEKTNAEPTDLIAK